MFNLTLRIALHLHCGHHSIILYRLRSYAKKMVQYMNGRSDHLQTERKNMRAVSNSLSDAVFLSIHFPPSPQEHFSS